MPRKAVILSAPSGSGKTTLVKHLLQVRSNLGFAISAATRYQRTQHEKHGRDYYFLSLEDFKKKIDRNEFIEWEEVYKNRFYGTLRSEVQRIWNNNKNIIFDIDVKGAMTLKKHFGAKALSVFIKAPSLEIVKQRLISRNTETPETLSVRLAKIKAEMTFENQFDTVLINDNLEQSKQAAVKLYDAFTKH